MVHTRKSKVRANGYRPIGASLNLMRIRRKYLPRLSRVASRVLSAGPMITVVVFPKMCRYRLIKAFFISDGFVPWWHRPAEIVSKQITGRHGLGSITGQYYFIVHTKKCGFPHGRKS